MGARQSIMNRRSRQQRDEEDAPPPYSRKANQTMPCPQHDDGRGTTSHSGPPGSGLKEASPVGCRHGSPESLEEALSKQRRQLEQDFSLALLKVRMEHSEEKSKLLAKYLALSDQLLAAKAQVNVLEKEMSERNLRERVKKASEERRPCHTVDTLASSNIQKIEEITKSKS